MSLANSQSLSLDDLPGEIWKPIPDYEGLYEVSNKGRIKSLDRLVTMSNGRVRPTKGFMLKQTRGTRTGYNHVCLSRNGIIITVNTHVIVLTSFKGPCPHGMVCRHFPDQDKGNNKVENLNWGTHSENQLDRVANGTGSVGEDNPAAVLNGFKVRRIRKMRDQKISVSTIAEVMECSTSAVWSILYGTSWAHIK